eukprot:m.180859 g.180859  ORF g.180859 m.180859 type:complete len:120 (+) comp14657_c0_seq4:125-484(+)
MSESDTSGHQMSDPDTLPHDTHQLEAALHELPPDEDDTEPIGEQEQDQVPDQPPSHTDFFADLEAAPENPVFGLARVANEDQHPDKMNLVIGGMFLSVFFVSARGYYPSFHRMCVGCHK